MKKNIVKPEILPGFMELLPKDQILFNKIKETISKNYEKFGFLPIDTPIIEKSEVLLAKAGGETEKQIYRFTKGKNDIALRFDLTVPLARYVAKNQSNLTFPFKRYHIGKVYRGEKAQRGRYREFYQCDIDIIGNEKLSLVNDAEIPAVIYSTFKELDFGDFTIKINNRKVLNGIFEEYNIENKVDVLRIIDKLEKIGQEKVEKELIDLGLTEDTVKKLLTFIMIKGTNNEIIGKLKALNVQDSMFCEGLYELGEVVKHIKAFGVPEDNFTIDLTIARGLDYYTGTVYETFLNDYPKIGSVCSGGRYDNLAEYYTKSKLPGVGVSIGLTRLFYQLQEANLIKSNDDTLIKALIVTFDDKDLDYAIKVSNKLRKNDIITQVYFENKKVNKKFDYANKLNIPYVIIIGEDEVNTQTVAVKCMESGTQKTVTIDEAVEMFN
ncbi:histidine--tRNA ligase [Abyssisolibacter fermentans]|uniref:histidine--tRNA ligase n=1 Tax=Abyssisolibacter fermentans TaxID=1766203 RepID=UPI0008298CFE|nr:histidine--tRNA ligase [Abyssisolibacter fermentans]